MNDARRYLYIDVNFPRPDRDSASIRASQFLGFLAAHGQLDMASLGSHGLDDPAVDAAEVAAAHGADLDCAPGAANIRGHLRAHGAAYHSVVCAWCRSATALLADARTAAPQACLVFDTVDANHLRLIRQARATGNARRVREALRGSGGHGVARADRGLVRRCRRYRAGAGA